VDELPHAVVVPVGEHARQAPDVRVATRQIPGAVEKEGEAFHAAWNLVSGSDVVQTRVVGMRSDAPPSPRRGNATSTIGKFQEVLGLRAGSGSTARAIWKNAKARTQTMASNYR